MTNIIFAAAALRRAAAIMLIVCGTASAQEPERAFVTNTGKATVYAAPTHVVFWIHRTMTAEKLNLALEETVTVDPAVREAVTLKELHPSLLETSTPAVVSMQENTVRVSTELRFPMGAYAAGETALVKFGELCEQIKEIGAGMGGEVTGPGFMTTEKAAVVQDAVQEAAKDAYPGAAGAAEALGATLRAVDLIDVGEVLWNAPPDTEAAFPTLSQIACTAEVRVTYILEYP